MIFRYVLASAKKPRWRYSADQGVECDIGEAKQQGGRKRDLEGGLARDCTPELLCVSKRILSICLPVLYEDSLMVHGELTAPGYWTFQDPTKNTLYNSKDKLGKIKKMSLWFDERFEGATGKDWRMRTDETLLQLLRHKPKLGNLELLCVSIDAMMNPPGGYGASFDRIIADDAGGPGP